jgi:hypothetical protein
VVLAKSRMPTAIGWIRASRREQRQRYSAWRTQNFPPAGQALLGIIDASIDLGDRRGVQALTRTPPSSCPKDGRTRGK